MTQNTQSEVARTLKKQILLMREYLDSELEKLSERNDDESIALERIVQSGEDVSQNEINAKLYAVVRRLHNQEQMTLVRLFLDRLEKTVERIDQLSEMGACFL